MNQLQINGTQSFMGKEIPVILGGFGPDKKCISDKTIAEIHGMRTPDVRRRISDNLKRFAEKVDYVDLLIGVREAHTSELLKNIGYSQQSIIQTEHIYILSERGYAKLIKIMDTDLAWEIHDKLIDEYFALREEKAAMQELSPELQMFKHIFDSVAQTQLEQRRQEKALEDTNKRIDDLRDVVALNPNSWRPDARKLIVGIAQKMGGNEFIQNVQAEIYSLVDARAGVSLATRLTNKRRRMADEGVCKSTRNKLNKIDVIADDKKLIEIYVAVVKEMAVKYGACPPKQSA